MKKVYFVLLLSIFSFHFALAQVILQGRILDNNNNPLPGANIVITETQQGTVSNNMGYYKITNMDAGKYTLKVVFIGFESFTKKIDLKSNKSFDIKLFPKTIMTNEIIVSSTYASKKTPVTKTNVTKDEIQNSNTTDDIPQLLSQSPSVVSSTESGIGIGYTSMRIRGTDPSRINVTINGIPLNDAEDHGVYWVDMPDFSSSLDNIQIQRGVGTSTNGAAAFGASVNFSTLNYSNKPYAEVNSTAGSYNTFKNSISASTGLLDNKFSFDVRYTRIQSDGYIDNAFSDNKSLFISGSMILPNSFLKANIIYGDERTGIAWWGVPEDSLKTNRTYNPAGEYVDENGNTQYYKDQTDNYKQTHYQLFYSYNISHDWLLNTALFYTRGDGYYEQYKSDESYADYGWDAITLSDGTEISTTDLIRQKWLGNDFYGGTASLNYNKARMTVNIGGGWNKYNGDHFGKVIWARYAGTTEKDYEWYKNTGIKTDYNVYAKINYQLSDKLNIYADVQYRGIDYTIEGTDDDLAQLNMEHNYQFFNPKAGLYYSLNDKSNLYLSCAVAHREPTRTNFVDAKNYSSETPQEEELTDYEFGYTLSTEKTAINANIYYMHYNDQLVPTGKLNDVGNSIMQNVDDSYRAGIELNLTQKIGTKLLWNINTTLSKNQIKNFIETSTAYYDDSSKDGEIIIEHGNTQIAYSPSFIAGSTLTYTPFKNFKIQITGKHIGEQYFDNTEDKERQLDAYTVFNGIITKEFQPTWMKKIELQLTINNLTNKLYESNAYGGNYFYEGVEYSWSYYYPQAGRHAFIKAKFLF